MILSLAVLTSRKRKKNLNLALWWLPKNSWGKQSLSDGPEIKVDEMVPKPLVLGHLENNNKPRLQGNIESRMFELSANKKERLS